MFLSWPCNYQNFTKTSQERCTESLIVLWLKGFQFYTKPAFMGTLGYLLNTPACLAIFSFYIHRRAPITSCSLNYFQFLYTPACLTHPARLLKSNKWRKILPFFYSKTANKSGLVKWYLIVWLISVQILIFLPFKTINWDLTHFLVSIKQAGVLNYFQLLHTPACLIHPAYLTVLKILYTGALKRYCLFNRYLRVVSFTFFQI